MIKKFQEFLRGVESEMKKISWPTFEQLRGSTGVVLVLSLILVIFLFVVDFALSRIVSVIL
ncbi:MAG: preprotein translocase subunit SecE [Candidatus Marinimicrobia bacterium]|nr:preprotein translocase subunit SecE [Candidatus Neomarinimicrobiota bacterium]